MRIKIGKLKTAKILFVSIGNAFLYRCFIVKYHYVTQKQGAVDVYSTLLNHAELVYIDFIKLSIYDFILKLFLSCSGRVVYSIPFF